MTDQRIVRQFRPARARACYFDDVFIGILVDCRGKYPPVALACIYSLSDQVQFRDDGFREVVVGQIGLSPEVRRSANRDVAKKVVHFELVIR